MKKLTITFMMLLMASVAVFAQDIKGSTTKAKAFLDKGDLSNAKLYIEAYLESEKFQKKPKASAYVTLAQVYMGIAKSNTPEDQKLLDNPIKKTLEAFDKVKELSGGKGGDYDKVFDNQGYDMVTMQIKPSMLEEFGQYFFKKGADNFNNKKYDSAIISFGKALEVNDKDTFAVLYGFEATRIEEKNKEMYVFGDQLVALGYDRPSPYLILSYDQYVKGSKKADEDKEGANKHYEKMLYYVNKGLEVVHDSLKADLRTRQVKALIYLDKLDDAINELKSNVEKDPKDKESLYFIGSLYSSKEDLENTKKYFDMALKVDPDYYNVNSDYAALYIKETTAVFKELQEQYDSRGNYKDEAKAKELEKKYDNSMLKAIPYLEKCRSLDSSDKAILQNLALYYQRLDMMDKYKEVAKDLDALD